MLYRISLIKLVTEYKASSIAHINTRISKQTIIEKWKRARIFSIRKISEPESRTDYWPGSVLLYLVKKFYATEFYEKVFLSQITKKFSATKFYREYLDIGRIIQKQQLHFGRQMEDAIDKQWSVVKVSVHGKCCNRSTLISETPVLKTQLSLICSKSSVGTS